MKESSKIHIAGSEDERGQGAVCLAVLGLLVVMFNRGM